MKRLALFTAALVLVVLLSPNRAYAVCQKCNDNFSLNAMCWTIGACEKGATMSACVVKEMFNPDGSIATKYCDAEGTTQGPECNGKDPSCTPTGGGTGAAGGGGGKTTFTVCTIAMWELCDPSLCDLCLPQCWLLC